LLFIAEGLQPELALALIGCEENAFLPQTSLKRAVFGVVRGNPPALLLRESHGKYEDYGRLSMV